MIHIEKRRGPKKSPVKSLYPLLDLIDKKIYPKLYYEKNREIYQGSLLPMINNSLGTRRVHRVAAQVDNLSEPSLVAIPDQNPIIGFFKDSSLYLMGSLAAVILIIGMIAKFRIKIF